MIIANGSHRYDIGKQVADAGAYRLYLSTNEGSDRQYLLQIADGLGNNGRLERAAYVLSELARRSDEVEKEYAAVRTDPHDRLNYALGFPELIDTFSSAQQGGRRVNMIGFRGVQDVGNMIPLVNIRSHRVRPDLRTSVWIMGKLLKLLTFAHSEGISVGSLAGSNILIEKDAHYALIFDWSGASAHQDRVPLEARREDIAQAAKSIITLLGGDVSTGVFPEDEGGRFHPYVDYLFRLACGGESKTERAHAKFYELADSLWKPEFYAFTVKPL